MVLGYVDREGQLSDIWQEEGAGVLGGVVTADFPAGTALTPDH